MIDYEDYDVMDTLSVGGIYRNKKTGDLYVLESFANRATNALDGGFDVIYHEKGDPDHAYTREIKEFNQKFVYVDQMF